MLKNAKSIGIPSITIPTFGFFFFKRCSINFQKKKKSKNQKKNITNKIINNQVLTDKFTFEI